MTEFKTLTVNKNAWFSVVIDYQEYIAKLAN